MRPVIPQRAVSDRVLETWWRLRSAVSRSEICERPFQYATSRELFARVAGLERSERWPLARQRRFAAQARARVVRLAAANVPFYRDRYREAGIDLQNLEHGDGFAALPPIDKADVRAAGESLRDPTVDDEQTLSLTTGGSTGEPLRLWQSRACDAWEEAFVWRHWRWFGLRYLDRAAICRGLRAPNGESIGVDATKGLVLSGFDLSWQSARRYLDALWVYAPRYLRAYPSTAHLLARRALADGDPPPRTPIVVLTSSELLLPDQRETIARAFGGPVADLYGHAERTIAAGECPAGRLHAFVEYGHVEILDDEGRPCAPGVEGELVGTAYRNPAFPLIRYRTGDRAAFVDERCPCGRTLPVLRLAGGRAQDVIVTPEGARVSVAALNFHSRIFDGIERVRFVQESPVRVVMEYTLVDPRRDIDERAVETELRTKLGRSLQLAYRRRETIEVSPSGKHRFIVPLAAESPAGASHGGA